MEQKKDEEVKVEVNEDAELDKELGETLSSIRAENGKKDEKPAVPAEDKTVTPPVESTEKPPSPAIDDKSPIKDEDKAIIEGFKTPTKGKFESEESYHARLKLADLVAERKAAKTDGEKKKISEDISNTRRELSTLNVSDKIIKPNNGEDKPKEAKTEAEEALDADKARLKELGGATKEDLQEMIRQERHQGEVKSTLETFINRHPELQDEDTREVFFDFVDTNYKWDTKSGKELMTMLELARENMFKPSESIQERVLKGANVQEKVNAMQFPGGTIVKPAISPELKKDIEELKATGMSEEKAFELLSD